LISAKYTEHEITENYSYLELNFNLKYYSYCKAECVSNMTYCSIYL